MNGITHVDGAVVVIYAALTAVLAWLAARRQKGADDYFTGGKSMNGFAVGLSIFAAAFSAAAFVMLPREGAYRNWSILSVLLLIPLLITPLLWHVFVPLYMRLGKLRGSHMKKSMPIGPFRTYWLPVNVGRLAEAFQPGEEVTPEQLVAKRIIKNVRTPVKILGGGELSKAVTVQAHAFSKSAQAAIEAAGGSTETLERTDQWTQARPRSRRLPINRELKQMRVGKVGGPSRREALAQLEQRDEAKEA